MQLTLLTITQGNGAINRENHTQKKRTHCRDDPALELLFDAWRKLDLATPTDKTRQHNSETSQGSGRRFGHHDEGDIGEVNPSPGGY